MEIDWFTISAQLINFLILVWLLKRFLYRPILAAIDKREKRISVQIKNADQKMADAQVEIDELKRKNSEFDIERESLIAKAVEDAQAQGQAVIDRSVKEARDIAQSMSAELEKERRNYHHAASRSLKEEVYAVSRKAMRDLADAEMEKQIIKNFVMRLELLDEESKTKLKNSEFGSIKQVIINTAFPLTGEMQEELSLAIHRNIGPEAGIKYAKSDDLICGIELFANGQKVSWNLDEFITKVEENADEKIESAFKS